MKESFRVLRPGGALVIAHAKSADKVNVIHSTIGGAIGHDLIPDSGSVLSTVRQAGFEIEYSVFDNRIGIICRKPVI